MASEWKYLPFNQAVLVNPQVCLDRGHSYPFVDMGSINPGSRCVCAAEERAFTGGGARFQSGDTLMARITPCLENGKVAQYSDQERTGFAFGSTEFIVIRGRPKFTDTNYAYYLTKWNEVQDYAIGQMTGTSGRQRVPAESLNHLIVPVPPLPEQRAIAHILGTLDDKIELNRKMNETLEAMARAIFKAWFVDFEPVRAKMEGRWQRGQSLPGLPAQLYDLFPDRLVDSELGEIPEGWEISPFAENVEIIGGGTPKTSVAEYWDGEIPWFSVVDAPFSSDLWVMNTEKKITEEGLKNSSTKVLPIGSTIVSARGTVGRIALVGKPMAMNQSCYALRGKTGTQGTFNYYTTRALIEILKQHVHGSVFDTITRDTLAGVKVVVPPGQLAEIFEANVGPFLQQIRTTLLESQTISSIRDKLLPKLISGNLRVNAIQNN